MWSAWSTWPIAPPASPPIDDFIADFVLLPRHRQFLSQKTINLIYFNVAPLKAAEARVGRLNEELEQRVIERINPSQKRNDELKAPLAALKNTQARLLQSEKMASIGQLAAGVAYEIHSLVGKGPFWD